MRLLERVATLLRANLNDLLDRADDPEKLSKQILLDLENQLLQVKTQVAVALAEAHRLGRQEVEHQATQAEWRRRAELAVGQGHDDLARAALARSVAEGRLVAGFAAQHAGQMREAASLRGAYARLEAKLTETRARVELLLAQHRRNQAARAAASGATGLSASPALDQLTQLDAAVAERADEAALQRAVREVLRHTSLEERMQTLEQQDEIEALLLELKNRQPRLP